jgi:hypothetical protein
MFSIEVPKEVLSHCELLINRINFGNRGIGDGNKSEQLTGVIGQCTIQYLLNIPLIDFESKFDGGIDIIINNRKIDIKTMGRKSNPKPFFVNNLIGLQIHFEVDIYIFCSLNKTNNVLTVCGWISKKDFLLNASLHEKGSYRYRSDGTKFSTKADLYEIENSKLNQISSIEDLLSQINKSKLN